ncbi:MAG: DUF885 domain-containing protein [Planctomycetota bacterium]
MNRPTSLLSAVLLAAALSCASPDSEAPPAPATAGPDAATRLAAIVGEEWEARLADDPLFASAVGRREWADRLPDVSSAAQARRSDAAAGFLSRLVELPTAELDAEDRVTHSMLTRQLEDRVLSIRFREYETPLNADSGFHKSLARLGAETELGSAEDARAYIARIGGIPAYVDQQIDNMRAGMAAGRVLPRVVMLGFGSELASVLVEDSGAHPYVQAIDGLPATVSDAERASLRAAAARAVDEHARPAFARFRTFLMEEYVPRGRASLGASELPEGERYYAWLVRKYTTLDTVPADVHARGLSEVARIRADMDAVIEELGFEGTFEDFLAFLRSEPRFYAASPDELLTRAARICKTVDGLLPRYFGLLPRQPYGVEPVPPEIAPKYTTGRYVRAPLKSDRAGTYWVNTYDLASRPLYALPALSLHEAVPGHHLQIALTAELGNLPPFRRHSYVTAFGEGWALYTEWLGKEMGVYEDPYDEFGRLTYEMWRACRLVVDTGLHAYGWTREEAIDYLASNTALSLHECTTETDRHISWPGQALAYKTGELEIRALRAEAEERLGPAFDLRAFHDTVLGSGSLPMEALRERVRSWIAAGG